MPLKELLAYGLKRSLLRTQCSLSRRLFCEFGINTPCNQCEPGTGLLSRVFQAHRVVDPGRTPARVTAARITSRKDERSPPGVGDADTEAGKTQVPDFLLRRL